MGEMNCPLFFEAIAFAQMYRSRLVLSDPIEGYDDRTFERRGEKRRRRMRPVMLRILDITLKTHVVSDLCTDRKLVMHKAGYVLLKNTTRPWPILDDLVPKPVQLYLRVFTKHDARKIVDRDAARLQAVGDRQRRKSTIVLSAAQPLLLNGEFYFAVVDNRHCAVVV